MDISKYTDKIVYTRSKWGSISVQNQLHAHSAKSNSLGMIKRKFN